MSRYRTPAVLATAVAGLIGAATASAAPAVQSVDLERVSPRRVMVTVETLRGTGTTEPRVTVRIGKRIARLTDTDWDQTMAPDETAIATGTLRVRAKVGATLRVRVRVCDDTCARTLHAVTVTDGDAVDDGPISTPAEPGTPTGGSGISSDAAVKIALARVAGGTLIGVERASRIPGAWKVKVAGGDGLRREIVVGADGAVIREEIDDDHRDDAYPSTPLPVDSISSGKAAEIAVAHVGGGSVREVERSRLAGAVWRVEVRQGGVEHEVDIAADGTVMRSVIDD